jgi:hypothetical protein
MSSQRTKQKIHLTSVSIGTPRASSSRIKGNIKSIGLHFFFAKQSIGLHGRIEKYIYIYI